MSDLSESGKRDFAAGSAATHPLCRLCISRQNFTPTYNPNAWCYMFKTGEHVQAGGQGYCGQFRQDATAILSELEPNKRSAMSDEQCRNCNYMRSEDTPCRCGLLKAPSSLAAPAGSALLSAAERALERYEWTDVQPGKERLWMDCAWAMASDLRQVLRPNAERSDRGKAGKASAFTLTEVLCVVALIALLISMLLPSVSRAAQVARARTEWCAYWHQAQIVQTASTDGEFTGYWQMSPDAAFNRLYASRGIAWRDVDSVVIKQWRDSIRTMASVKPSAQSLD